MYDVSVTRQQPSQPYGCVEAMRDGDRVRPVAAATAGRAQGGLIAFQNLLSTETFRCEKILLGSVLEKYPEYHAGRVRDPDM